MAKSFAEECAVAAATLTRFAGKLLDLSATVAAVGAKNFSPEVQAAIVAVVEGLVNSDAIDAASTEMKRLSGGALSVDALMEVGQVNATEFFKGTKDERQDGI
jgi:hypothetical protein